MNKCRTAALWSQSVGLLVGNLLENHFQSNFLINDWHPWLGEQTSQKLAESSAGTWRSLWMNFAQSPPFDGPQQLSWPVGCSQSPRLVAPCCNVSTSPHFQLPSWPPGKMQGVNPSHATRAEQLSSQPQTRVGSRRLKRVEAHIGFVCLL